jgi:inhibitor of cysteine peptidase
MVLTAGLFPLVLTACAGGDGTWVLPTPAAQEVGTRIRITGVVRHSELEGGFYAIQGDDGVTYDPTNLPVEFQEEGLAVEVEARRREDAMGIHQVGPIVEIERIRRR